MTERPITALDVVREYFPDISEDDADDLLWNETGYPGFWDIPNQGATPEEVLRLQLAQVIAREQFGEYGYFDGHKALEIGMQAFKAQETSA